MVEIYIITSVYLIAGYNNLKRGKNIEKKERKKWKCFLVIMLHICRILSLVVPFGPENAFYVNKFGKKHE